MTEKRGRGRPKRAFSGQKVSVILDSESLEYVDSRAVASDIDRSEAIRRIIRRAAKLRPVKLMQDGTRPADSGEGR